MRRRRQPLGGELVAGAASGKALEVASARRTEPLGGDRLLRHPLGCFPASVGSSSPGSRQTAASASSLGTGRGRRLRARSASQGTFQAVLDVGRSAGDWVRRPGLRF